MEFLARGRQRLGRFSRALLVIAAISMAVVLGLSRILEPDPRGYGTHTQLGLGPCAFATTTGRLCPTCGMTTAFAWFTRGRPERSWRANPAGCLAAALTIPTMVWLIACAIRGEPVGTRSLANPLMGLLVGLCLLTLTSWLIRWSESPAALTAAGPNPSAAVGAIGQ